MDINRVIEQLRAYCAPLQGRIGGAGDFETGIETVIAITDPLTGRLAYPSAVVIPLEDDASANAAMTGLLQIVTETIGVIVEFGATADRRGQAGVSAVEAMKYALHAALLNWVIDPDRAVEGRGIFYAGGQLVSFDRARLFWQFSYSFEALISDADGFQPRGDPLIELKAGTPANDPAHADPSIVFDIRD